MKSTGLLMVVPGLLLIASVVCLTGASSPSGSREEVPEYEIINLVPHLPEELRDIYDVIADPSHDDIKKENYILRGLELFISGGKNYEQYRWFYDWLVWQSAWFGDKSPGRHTPRHGHGGGGGPGGRTHGHRGGLGHGGRSKRRRAGPGDRKRRRRH